MKRSYGNGTVETRGNDVHRLRYIVNGERFSTTFHGSLTDARKELRGLIKSGDDGDHIEPTKITVAEWIDRWIALLGRERPTDAAAGEPGDKVVRKRGSVNPRTLERYAELLRCHVKPTLGETRLQKLQATKIDELYIELEGKIAVRTVHHVHVVFKACIKSAVSKKLLRDNPVAAAEAPTPDDDAEVGIVLEPEQLRTLLQGFKGTVFYPIVVTAALTGARRNEILALRWRDLDVANKTLRIERSVEETKKFGLQFKEPKRAKHKRTIAVDPELVTLLCAEREKYLRLIAGVRDGTAVDLSLVRLPDDALMFPNLVGDMDLAAPRHPRNTSKEIKRRVVALGFPGMRPFHDLRVTHETSLLDDGVPVHVVAARCGHDPAVLLRVYAKRTKRADQNAAAAIGRLSHGLLNR